MWEQMRSNAVFFCVLNIESLILLLVIQYQILLLIIESLTLLVLVFQNINRFTILIFRKQTGS
jgi:hypothetical protein